MLHPLHVAEGGKLEAAILRTAQEVGTMTPSTEKIWTDAEFMALPDNGHRYELVNGALVEMGKSR